MKHKKVSPNGTMQVKAPTVNEKILAKLEELTDRRMLPIPLDEYQNLLGTIEDQKGVIEELRAIHKPKLRITLGMDRNSYHPREDEQIVFKLLGNKSPWVYIQADIETLSENEQIKDFVATLEKKFEVSKSFEEGAWEAIKGLRKKQEEWNESLKRVPWWLRWAIKPEPESARV